MFIVKLFTLKNVKNGIEMNKSGHDEKEILS